MKKTLIRAAAALLAVLILAGAFPAQAATYTGTVNKDKVFFRTSATTGSAWHAMLDKGTRVTLTGARGNFFAVTYNKQVGYIMRSLVDAPGAALKAFGRDLTELATKDELDEFINEARAEWAKAKGKVVDTATMTKEEVSDFVRFLFEEAEDLKERMGKDFAQSADEVADHARKSADHVRHGA